VTGVERSERNVSIDNIARIARGHKVRASELLTDIDTVAIRTNTCRPITNRFCCSAINASIVDPFRSRRRQSVRTFMLAVDPLAYLKVAFPKQL
jgi:hypothetical protein